MSSDPKGYARDPSMVIERTPELHAVIEHAYEVFSKYDDPGTNFCSFCYSISEIEYLTSTPLRKIEGKMAAKLVFEAADHFQSSEVYRYFLPRILDVLAPPTNCEDIYTEHFFEVLADQRFAFWPNGEKSIIIDYIEAMKFVMDARDPEDAKEWRDAAAKLRFDPIRLPPG